jgi:hypothetical protein
MLWEQCVNKKRMVQGEGHSKRGERFVWSENQNRSEESLFCIVHRFCTLNSPSREELLTAIGLERDTPLTIELQSGKYVFKESRLVAINPKLTVNEIQEKINYFLESKLYIGKTQETSLSHIWFKNEGFFTPSFRFCNECLSNFAFHSIIFQCIGIDKCPVHNSKLQTRCPKCKFTICTILNGKNLKFNFTCQNCHYSLVPKNTVINPPAIPNELTTELKKNRRYLQKIMKKNIFYLQSQHQNYKRRNQNYENINVWSALSYFSSIRHNDYQIEFEKKPDLELTINCGNAFSLLQSLNLYGYYRGKLFTRVFESFCKEKLSTNFNLDSNKSTPKYESFYKDVVNLMRGKFLYGEDLTNFFHPKRLSDLDKGLHDKYIDLSSQRLPVMKAVSISNKSFCLAHTIILELVCYIAYLHGLFKECAEITRLTADKSDEIKCLAADGCLGTAIPQIIGEFDGPQLWLHVYFSPIDRMYLKKLIQREEKRITEFYESISNVFN